MTEVANIEEAGTGAPPGEASALDDGAAAMPPSAMAPGRRSRQAGLWLGLLLGLAFVVVVGGVAAAPFWAPAVMPLLPWGRSVTAAADAGLKGRIEALEQRPAAASAEALARVEAETTALARRLDQVEAAARQPAANTAALDALRQDVARLDRRDTERGDRISGIEAKIAASASAGGHDAALILSLIELREAVSAGRPFVAEYRGFAGLAQDRPELEAAALPLSHAAAEGVASRAALSRELSDLAGRLAAPTPSVPREWWQQALARLRGLVTVRRIGVPQSGPEAAVAAAQAALADDDLAGAVRALAALPETDARIVGPWLQQARARLAAEAALASLQARLTAGLGATPNSGPETTPARGPPPPAKRGAPS